MFPEEEAELLPFDVGNESQVESVINNWKNEHPNDYIAYLVNNAGIRRDNVMFIMPTEDWYAVVNTSLNGCIGRPMRNLALQISEDGSLVISGKTIISGYVADDKRTTDILLYEQVDVINRTYNGILDRNSYKHLF